MSLLKTSQSSNILVAVLCVEDKHRAQTHGNVCFVVAACRIQPTELRKKQGAQLTAIAERSRWGVCQFWPKVEDWNRKHYFRDITGLCSTTVT